MKLNNIALSILDLAPVVEGSTAADSFRNSLDLAQHAERWGYKRYWLAEHHNMPGIASSATSVVIGHIAAGTQTIRVGSGGIMLPNHAPLLIAEQFGTLESLFPGRIDLGLGRAPGSDGLTARAVRRGLENGGDNFPELLQELRGYFEPITPGETAAVRAYPGAGLDIPIWLLGSSGFSAQLAGQLGLPFAFASHFAPDYLLQALQLYHSSFRPSDHLDKPYAMVALNVIAADSDEEAQRLATSQQQQFLNIVRGQRGLLRPPVDNMDELWNEQEKAYVRSTLKYTFAGTKQSIKEKLEQFVSMTQANELIVATQLYDHQARLRSYELLAELVQNEC